VAVWRYSALTILLECGAKWNGNGDNVVEERFFRGHKKMDWCMVLWADIWPEYLALGASEQGW